MTRRVAVVGLGAISTRWLEVLAARDDVEIVGLVDVDEAHAEEQRRAFGLAARIEKTLAPTLEAEKPDLVINLTPPFAHRGVAEQALEAGCDVIVEKPLTDVLADAVALVDVAERTGRTLAVMQNRRHHPGVRRLQETVASGAIGDVVHVCADMFLWHIYRIPFLVKAPHPLLSDMAIHPFDAVRAITRLEPKTVQAVEWTSSMSWFGGPAGATCTFELEGGAVFSYRGSWISEGHETGYDGAWRVGCTRGSITWDGNGGLVTEQVSRPDGVFAKGIVARTTEATAHADENTHAIAVDAIIGALDRGETPETSAADNVRSLAMVEAAVRSARERRPVSITAVLDEAGWTDR